MDCLSSSGTKIDLRENKEAIGQLASQGLSPVKREQGIKLANKIRAVKYMECSALTQRGLKQVGIYGDFKYYRTVISLSYRTDTPKQTV